jgi:hypothetical protein
MELIRINGIDWRYVRRFRVVEKRKKMGIDDRGKWLRCKPGI